MQLFRFSLPHSLVLICVLLAGCNKKEAEPAGRGAGGAQFVVDVVTLKPRPFQETLTATGSLLARDSVHLQAERAGVVKEIRFEEGKAARAGDVLAVLDGAELEAQLTRAQAQLELAGTVERRHADLFRTGALISEAEYEQAQANLRVAGAEVKLIQAQLDKTRIVAPFDGVAGLRQVSAGAYVTPGTAIGTFQDISSLRLDFSLPERYLEYVHPGQKVLFRIVGRTERFEAAIAAIEPAIDVATRSLQVRALAPNPARRLLPGAFAEVEVVLDEVPDAILIPPIALIPGLKQQTVFLYRDGQVESRQVQPGLRLADAVQIVDGLRPGDELITSGILQLRPGMRVQARRLTDASSSAPGGDEGLSDGPPPPRPAEPAVAKKETVQ